MEQNTDAWREWRLKGLGSSDGPVIMNKSPWKTRFQLWEEKTGRVTPSETASFIQNKGNELEPIVRSQHEALVGFSMPATLFENQKARWLRSSLDGYNGDCNPPRGLEIKYVGKEDHEGALEGKVPEKYYYQLVHQFVVTGVGSIDYVSYFLPKGTPYDEGKLVCVEVFRPTNEELLRYFKEAEKFWNLVLTDTPPALTDKDYKLIRSVEMKKVVVEWKQKKLELTKLELEVEELKDKMVALAGKDQRFWRVENTGVKMTTVERIGAIQYGSIPQLEGIDLNKYRGKSTTFTKITIEKASSESI